MAAPRTERRLTAILAADVVGYSSLMERNEARTVGRLCGTQTLVEVAHLDAKRLGNRVEPANEL